MSSTPIPTSSTIDAFPVSELQTSMFHDVVDAAPDPIIVTDRGGHIVMVNRRTLEVFGYTRDELQRQPIERLIPDRLREKHRGHRARYSGAPSVRPMGSAATHLTGLKKDGSEVPVDVSLSPIESSGAMFVVAILRDVSHRVLVEQRLRYVGTHDALTGLYNRAFFDEELARLDRGRHPVGVLVADLDSLKLINDRFGHARGDELLRRAAAVLSGALRAEDVVARLGGDEFGALVPHATGANLARIMERIRASARADAGDAAVSALSLSLGATTATPGSLRAALATADEAMYAEKRARRESKILQGDLAQVGLPSVLSFLELEQRTGELVVFGPRIARIRLRSGLPLRVSFDDEGVRPSGEEQQTRLFDVFAWTRGQFEFVGGDDLKIADEVRGTVTGLLLEYARRKDESDRSTA